MITKDIDYPLKEITKNKRLIQLEANLKHGNHLTYSSKAEQHIIDFTKLEVSCHYLIKILKEKVIEIPRAKVCLIHIVT